MSDVSNPLTEYDTPAPSTLWTRNYKFFVYGTGLSFFGTQFFLIVQTLVVKEVTESGTIVGLLLALGALPMLIFGTAGGVIADRMSKRRLMVVSDLISGTIVLILAILALLEVSTVLMVGAIFMLSILLESASAFRQPSARAILPLLVTKSNLRIGNGTMTSVRQLCGILGQIIGGLLYAFAGTAIMFIVDSISYYVSAFFLKSMYDPEAETKKEADFTGECEKAKYLSNFWHDIRGGAKAIRGVPNLILVVIVLAISDFFTAQLIVFMPFITENQLGLPKQWFGYMTAALATGALIGGLASRTFKFAGIDRGYLLPMFLVMTALARICIGMSGNVYIVMFSLFAETCAAVMFSVWIYSTIQECTPENYMGRVFGYVTVVAGIVSSLGMAAGGILLDIFPNNIDGLVKASGACMLLTALTAFASPRYRSFFEGTHQ